MKKENDELIGLVLEENEKSELYKLCKQYKIQVPYKSLFQDDVNYHLWGFSKKGIGLVGTLLIRNLKTVLHGVDEFKTYLEKEYSH